MGTLTAYDFFFQFVALVFVESYYATGVWHMPRAWHVPFTAVTFNLGVRTGPSGEDSEV